jgi:hypothetical protein
MQAAGLIINTDEFFVASQRVVQRRRLLQPLQKFITDAFVYTFEHQRFLGRKYSNLNICIKQKVTVACKCCVLQV